MTNKAIGKRTVLLLASIVAMLIACSGVAFAVIAVDCGSLLQDPLTPLCEGTRQDDDILGRNSGDTIQAFQGSDTVHANGGDDHVDASADDDLVYGGDGKDTLAGGSDDDGLFGGKGEDRLFDDLNPYADQDELRGGGGNDRLDAFDDDYNDTLVCGPGDDTVYFDLNTFLLKHDEVSDTCEHKIPGIKIAPRE